MTKYIDADRLRAEIEKRLKNTRDYMNGAGMKYKGPKHFKAQGKESAYDALLNLIDSLQQKHLESICSRCAYRNTTDDGCEYPYGGRNCPINENGVYECNGFEEVWWQEQPDVDLEKEVGDFGDIVYGKDRRCTRSINIYDFQSFARHFYELGLNARKEE